MNLRRVISMTGLAVVFATGLLVCQMPPDPPDASERAQHHLQFLTSSLSLSSAQQQQALTIFTSAAGSESEGHSAMKAAHEALQAAVKSNDAAAITQAATTIGNLTAQQIAAHAKAEAAFYQILTPDQQAKLSQMEAKGPGPRFDGFGGGHRPGVPHD